MIECNLQSNRIGVITVKDYKDFKLVLNNKTNEYEVIGNKDAHIWGRGKSTKGAVISACHCGVRLRDIDISDAYVPLKEVVEVLKS